MDNSQNFSIKIKNFKCFGEIAGGFETIKKINLIIGRNNSGKSSLLDLIEFSTLEKISVPQPLWHGNKTPEFIAELTLSEKNIRQVFSPNTGGGGIPGPNHFEFGKELIGARITWKSYSGHDKQFVALGPSPDGSTPFDTVRQDKEKHLQNLVNSVSSPLVGMVFRRIHAERNISPESDNPNDLNIKGDGLGATNVIQNFLNKASLPSNLVEDTLLNELNHIFGTDAHFKRILCQQLSDSRWEIYLEEETKGKISLSQSGSGLKTIILVLSYIHLLPIVEKKELSQFIFGFEELENNLHPSLLRRLLNYIKLKSENDNCTFFLTTHSNVAIDLLNKNEHAQILHVTHDKTVATVTTVTTYIDNKGVLDDLDVRASDLLQSNGVIWVEGPSDRIYLNRWISIWTDGELSEGNHYQCVFYGGRLLAHLSGEDPNISNEGISILSVNNNAIVMIDSDKRNQQTRLNDTKQRVIKEITENSGYAWITKGREVENYIPKGAVARWLKKDEKAIEQTGQYESFFDRLNKSDPKKGDYYKARKAQLAEELGPEFTRTEMEKVLDLSTQLDNICQRIRQWNNLI